MSKTIVICCDGTTNQMTGHETNVLRLYRALVRNDQQLTFYDPGVGTLADPMALTVVRKFVQRSLDAAIGRSLCQNFSDAYGFLSRYYETGDQIFMFGFSRGAYTARAVAGAIRMLGLLRKELSNLAPYVWAIYANDGHVYDVKSRFGGAPRFEALFCIERKPTIRLLGLWDTVSSFGWFWDFETLPHTYDNPSVELVRHAVSLDEHRAAFVQNLFREPVPPDSNKVKQVWFPGCHSDIGGGHPDKDGGLSKIAFRWMIEELRTIGGIALDDAVIHEILTETKTSSAPDAKANLHESLAGLWHLLELLPRRRWHKREDTQSHPPQDQLPAGKKQNLWHKELVWPHFWRRRRPPEGAMLHCSVQLRMASCPDYKPKLPNNPQFVGSP